MSTSTPLDNEIAWTRPELMKAWSDNQVAGIAAVGLTVQFLLKNEDRRGVVVQYNGCVKRFRSDSQAWSFIEALKEESLRGAKS